MINSYYHNDDQKSANEFRIKKDNMATAVSNTATVFAEMLIYDGVSWMVYKHDGQEALPITSTYYDPEFMVDTLMINDPKPAKVRVDLAHACKVILLMKPGDDKPYRVTRVYLETNENSAKEILLMA